MGQLTKQLTYNQVARQAMESHQKWNTFVKENQSKIDQIMKNANLKAVDPELVWNSGGLNTFFENRKRAMRQGFWTKQNGRYVKKYKIKTIGDMLRVDYPYMFDNNLLGGFAKDAPLISSTTAAYVATHGANAFHQVINEANLAGLLSIKPYLRGGYRALTAAGSTGEIGIAENAAVPATKKPTLQNVDIGIKEIAYSFNVSARQQFLSMIEDDAWAEGGSSFDAMRVYMGMEFNKLINRAYARNVTTLASTGYESIDRGISSYAEVTNCGDVDAGDSDIYGIDRDAGASWVDAYVNHNSNTDRDLTIALIKDVMENVQPNWGGPHKGQQAGNISNKIWVTGWDTKNQIEQLYEGQNTYVNLGQKVAVTLNGVKTIDGGAAVGFLVATLYGIPLFVSNDIVKDTLSRLYLIDLDEVHFSMGIPTMYMEAGFNKGTVVELDAFQNQGVYYQMGELKFTRFNVHGKLRDLQ